MKKHEESFMAGLVTRLVAIGVVVMAGMGMRACKQAVMENDPQYQWLVQYDKLPATKVEYKKERTKSTLTRDYYSIPNALIEVYQKGNIENQAEVCKALGYDINNVIDGQTLAVIGVYDGDEPRYSRPYIEVKSSPESLAGLKNLLDSIKDKLPAQPTISRVEPQIDADGKWQKFITQPVNGAGRNV